MTSTLLATLLLSLAIPPPVQSARTATSDPVEVARTRAFAGVAKGTATYRGADHELELDVDDAGRVRIELHGPLGVAGGHDGEGFWMCDERAGVPYEAGLWTADVERAWLAVWAGTWASESGGFDVSPPDEEGVVRLTSPRSTYEGRLVLDPETGTPRELTVDYWGGTRTWRFHDVEGGLARRVEALDVVGSVDEYRIEEVASALDAGRLVRPPRRSRAELDPEAAPELEVRTAPSGHLMVRPLVDGEEVGWWILDTGAAGATIEPETAERLGLPVVGRTYSSGGGVEKEATVIRAADTLELGPLVLHDPLFTQLEAPLPGIAGILGFDVLIQVVAEIDMKAPSVALLDPETYELPEGGSWDPLVLHLRHPHVRAAFEGDHEGLFRIDTGAGQIGAMFHTPTVDRLGLLEGRRTQSVQAMGAGGPIALEIGRVGWFEIGGRRIENATAAFCRDEAGALADPDSFGNLGGAVLPFRIVFDYARNRVAFLPR